MSQPSIVFMGTPDFAVPSLQSLHDAGFRIPLVVTQPDRPKGRGRTPAPPPVKLAAMRIGRPLLQPHTIRDDLFIDHLRRLEPDFLVVVAFGHILPLPVLRIPKRSAVNLHASLLPKFRGPAPIQWTVIRGETETGVTTILMDSGVDTGDILLSAKTAIAPVETAEDLHRRLAKMGGPLLVETIGGLWRGTLFPSAQKHDEATYAPMLRKTDGRVRWEGTAAQIDAFVRGMMPWPGAFCFLENQRLKLFKVRPLDASPGGVPPGTVVPGFPGELRVAAGKGCVSIEELQGASGKRMPIEDFLRGHPFSPGTRLT